jgi:hypothetical protein
MKTSRYFLPIVILSALLILPTQASRVLAESTGCKTINDNYSSERKLDIAHYGKDFTVVQNVKFKTGEILTLTWYAKKPNGDYYPSTAKLVKPAGATVTTPTLGKIPFEFEADETLDVKVNINVDNPLNIEDIWYRFTCLPTRKPKPSATYDGDEPTDLPSTPTTAPTSVQSPEPTQPPDVTPPETPIVSSPEPTTVPSVAPPINETAVPEVGLN